MKYLEHIRVVQFFLFERQDLRLSDITGIFGPNGSGKSSMLDAVQIAMLGANSRLVALNAQADEQATTRSLRAYCLGQYGESPEHRARENATTYITLVWRDSETREPLSMGVCLYASADKEKHEVLGRYILPKIELAMGDHLETVDGEERPRDWATFRHQLVERARVSGEDPLFNDSHRYIQAALLSLRGTDSTPHTESFIRSFRFALRMRFDKTVDQIVRNDVLESRPTNIKKFREVTESFRRLAALVAQIEAKIADGRRVEAEFIKAATESRRAFTWTAIGKMIAVEVARESFEHASESKVKAEEHLAGKNLEHKLLEAQVAHANAEALRFRHAREVHSAHKDYGALQTEIQTGTQRLQDKGKDLHNTLNLVRRRLAEAADSPFLESSAPALRLAAQKLDALVDGLDGRTRAEIESALRPSLKTAEKAFGDLFRQGGALERSIGEINEALKLAEASLARVKEGRAPLSAEVQRLLATLQDHGLNPVLVCDLVKITDPAWQPVIEAYLGPHIEALLVSGDEQEKEAFRTYRGLTGKRAVYGAKIAMESRQLIGRSAEAGTVAELIEGKDPAAVAYLRRQFGDLRRATTDAEALAAGKRTLTQDGMLVSAGEIERLRPVPAGLFRIGSGGAGQRDALQKEVNTHKAELTRLTQQSEVLKRLLNALRQVASEDMVAQHVLNILTDMDKASSDVAGKTQQLQGIADREYVRLGEQEKHWTDMASSLAPQVTGLLLAIGGVNTELNNWIKSETEAREKLERAESDASEARRHPEYDHDFWMRHWDSLLERFDTQHSEMVEHCNSQHKLATGRMNGAITKGMGEYGTFLQKYQEQPPLEASADWRKAGLWLTELMQRLDRTELANFRQEMDAAYRTSQETFRNDVAIALSNNLEWLEETMERLNAVLKACPTFSNGERYRFRRVVRPQLDSLLKFIKDVAAFGPTLDLLGGAGEVPEAFKQLIEDKIAPGAASVSSPLDDYREFFEFDIEILREDPLSKLTKVVGHLSKRLGPGSGGEHRAPLYVIAGAALASAYRLDRGGKDGLRLMLLDEAFNKMDMTNIIATMRYLEELGLQVFMASPGENLGTLTAFLHRYYDILRDADNNAIMLEGHDVSAQVRTQFREDLPEFNPTLVEEEVAAMRSRPIAQTSQDVLAS
ncbi:MAG: AAA family ATPase [Burkholderiales bacterium]|jgi:energy-coupling factor transporter ATP-binding protein EcfA2|nr:AAA family ATPase [Burkholderiales bacterium]